ELRARGRVQERLSARRHRKRRVLHERTDALRDLHAAGLAQQLDREAPPVELLLEGVRQRRLARAVEALDRDQAAARHPGTVASIRWNRCCPESTLTRTRGRYSNRRCARAGAPLTPTSCTDRP